MTKLSSFEKAIYEVRLLYYRVHDFDRLIAHMPSANDPVRIVHCRLPLGGGDLAWDVAKLTAQIAGLAVVRDGPDLVAVGSQLSMSFWEWKRYRPFAAARSEAKDSLDPPDTKFLEVHKRRAQRISELMVRHKVAELYPCLRIRASEDGHDPDGPEVQLRPARGGLQLGGIIFPVPPCKPY